MADEEIIIKFKYLKIATKTNFTSWFIKYSFALFSILSNFGLHNKVARTSLSAIFSTLSQEQQQQQQQRRRLSDLLFAGKKKETANF